MGLGVEDEIEASLESKNEMSIAQFITARIYAKKMIEFLRMRQAIKRIENERLYKIKEKQAAIAQAKRMIANDTSPSATITRTITPSVKHQTTKGTNNMFNGAQIIEEDGEYDEDRSDKEQLNQDIQDFLKNSRLHMQR